MLLAVINYFLKGKQVSKIELRRKTKRAMLSKMIKSQLDKIAKEKKISRSQRKAEMIEILVNKLKLDDVRKYYSEFFGIDEFDVLKHNLVPPHRILPQR